MFNKSTYSARRDALKKSELKGIAIFPANDEASCNYPDNTYHYRQDSNFSYFFGLNHPNLVGVIDFDKGKDILFGEEVTMDTIIWCGPQPSLSEQGASIGVKDTRDINGFLDYVRGAISKKRQVHILPPYRGDMLIRMSQWLGVNIEELPQFVSQALIEEVVKLREIKSEEEIAEMEYAAETAYMMHTTAMKMCKPGIKEQEISGTIEGIAIARGGMVSFPNIVSVDGQTLHNHSHHNILQEGRMLVVDAGAETENYYASDFTRTTPVGGRFNQRQKDIYEIVLKANMDVAAKTKPYMKYMVLHTLAVRTIIEGLCNLGLMKGDIDEALMAGAHYLFMPHGLGHALGMDVHDMEGLGEINVGYDNGSRRSSQQGYSCLRFGKTLKPGNVITDEPGIYFIPALINLWRSEHKHEAFINYDNVEKFKDFGGIRIEDDLLITAEGCRILGPGIPKTIEDVESFLRE